MASRKGLGDRTKSAREFTEEVENNGRLWLVITIFCLVFGVIFLVGGATGYGEWEEGDGGDDCEDHSMHVWLLIYAVLQIVVAAIAFVFYKEPSHADKLLWTFREHSSSKSCLGCCGAGYWFCPVVTFCCCCGGILSLIFCLVASCVLLFGIWYLYEADPDCGGLTYWTAYYGLWGQAIITAIFFLIVFICRCLQCLLAPICGCCMKKKELADPSDGLEIVTGKDLHLQDKFKHGERPSTVGNPKQPNSNADHSAIV